MIIPTNLVDKIIMPSSELYLYADDHRFTRNNYNQNNIPLYQTSILKIYNKDLKDKKNKKKKYKLNSAFNPDTDIESLKYQIRNHFFESLKLKSKSRIFNTNLIFWFVLNSWACLIQTKNIIFVIKRILFIYKCMKEGQKLKNLIRN